jgi:hypothetical protein
LASTPQAPRAASSPAASLALRECPYFERLGLRARRSPSCSFSASTADRPPHFRGRLTQPLAQGLQLVALALQLVQRRVRLARARAHLVGRLAHLLQTSVGRSHRVRGAPGFGRLGQQAVHAPLELLEARGALLVRAHHLAQLVATARDLVGLDAKVIERAAGARQRRRAPVNLLQRRGELGAFLAGLLDTNVRSSWSACADCRS